MEFKLQIAEKTPLNLDMDRVECSMVELFHFTITGPPPLTTFVDTEEQWLRFLVCEPHHGSFVLH